MSYDLVEELAHRIGRILHAAATPSLTDLIVNEVRIEFDAVDRAERGDLTGRARQAVELSRDDASPLQVAEADRLLRENPFGPDALLTDVDPTAASVAAAHWLRAAAVTAARVSGLPWTRVVAESDDIEATNFVTPTAILAALDRGLSPLEAVTTLVRNSKAIARGSAPDLKSLQQLCREVERAQSRSATETPVEYRMTPLDTRRPARDLLEDLLSGISACLLMYVEYWSPENEDSSQIDFEEELDEESEEPSPATIAFIDEVRLEAERTRAVLD
ncbi:hypothetical protein R8Z50_21900 [Longispora sp. K20-0274]|uniref:hypothetical protein n=1 Tax=Longispora sp. K20-0274 TaxID=3088255 RepID=UPI00399B46B8